jgi:FkbM family methyltransferase
MSEFGRTDQPPGISLDDAFELLYGAPPSDEQRAWMASLIAEGGFRNLSQLRTVIMSRDHQTHPTRVVVRFNESDLRCIDIEGFRLVVDAADVSVSGPMLAQGFWEQHLSRVFHRCIRTGMRVADIGANLGYYTMLAAKLVGEGGQVFAFEPNSENCRLLLLSAAENDLRNIRLVPIAVGESDGYAHFSNHLGSNGNCMPETASLSSGHGTIVPVARLDALISPPIDFIKMDVEGAEYRVLRGAQSLIATSRPIITSEFSCEMIARVSGCSPRDFLEFFLRYGYTIHVIRRDDHRLEQVPDIDAFLDAWGDLGRIEDLLMLPQGTTSTSLMT